MKSNSALPIEGGEFGTFDFIPEANQLIWSGKTKEFFGLPHDAHVNYETYIAAIHPEDRDTSKAIAQQQADLKEGGLYELEYRTIGITDGKLRWLRSKGKATYNIRRRGNTVHGRNPGHHQTKGIGRKSQGKQPSVFATP